MLTDFVLTGKILNITPNGLQQYNLLCIILKQKASIKCLGRVSCLVTVFDFLCLYF